MSGLRASWLRLHRWSALGLGWVLVLAGLTGSTLVVSQPLDRWLRSDLFHSSPPADSSHSKAAALAPILQELQSEFGPKVQVRFRLPQEQGESLWARIQSPWRGTVYFNPFTGKEQGRRGEEEGFVNFLFQLHSNLLLGSWGKVVLAWTSLAYLMLLFSGVVLWWPRQWPSNWTIVLDKSLIRALFDLHRVGGIVMGLLIAVSVFSGAYLAWRPLGNVFNFLSRSEVVQPPKLPNHKPTHAGVLPSIDELLAEARKALPDASASFVQISDRPNQAVRIRFRTPDEHHPNGISSVWLDPRTAKVLAAYRWQELDPAAGAAAILYPLHTGELGGALLQAVAGIVGLVLAGLGLTGILLWWGRHRARQFVRSRSRI